MIELSMMGGWDPDRIRFELLHSTSNLEDFDILYISDSSRSNPLASPRQIQHGIQNHSHLHFVHVTFFQIISSPTISLLAIILYQSSFFPFFFFLSLIRIKKKKKKEEYKKFIAWSLWMKLKLWRSVSSSSEYDDFLFFIFSSSDK